MHKGRNCKTGKTLLHVTFLKNKFKCSNATFHFIWFEQKHQTLNVEKHHFKSFTLPHENNHTRLVTFTIDWLLSRLMSSASSLRSWLLVCSSFALHGHEKKKNRGKKAPNQLGAVEWSERHRKLIQFFHPKSIRSNEADTHASLQPPKIPCSVWSVCTLNTAA